MIIFAGSKDIVFAVLATVDWHHRVEQCQYHNLYHMHVSVTGGGWAVMCSAASNVL